MARAAEPISERLLHVHLAPQLVSNERLQGSIAVVVDVLRATTTIIHALAAGCTSVRPCLEIAEARSMAESLRPNKVILAGERQGKKIDGFDFGNSPGDYNPAICKGATLVFTTTNGSKALLHAAAAERVLVAGFVNFSAVCEQLRSDWRPMHVICAGLHGEPALEDTLLAGAMVECLCDHFELQLNDSARLAWNCFETQGHVLAQTLELGEGGRGLKNLGCSEDILAAAQVDEYTIVPELQRDPLRIEISGIGIVRKHWPK